MIFHMMTCANSSTAVIGMASSTLERLPPPKFPAPVTQVHNIVEYVTFNLDDLKVSLTTHLFYLFQDRPVPPDATPLDIVNSLKPYHTLQLHK